MGLFDIPPEMVPGYDQTKKQAHDTILAMSRAGKGLEYETKKLKSELARKDIVGLARYEIWPADCGCIEECGCLDYLETDDGQFVERERVINIIDEIVHVAEKYAARGDENYNSLNVEDEAERQEWWRMRYEFNSFIEEIQRARKAPTANKDGGR
jgi:hypothetical protein